MSKPLANDSGSIVAHSISTADDRRPLFDTLGETTTGLHEYHEKNSARFMKNLPDPPGVDLLDDGAGVATYLQSAASSRARSHSYRILYMMGPEQNPQGD